MSASPRELEVLNDSFEEYLRKFEEVISQGVARGLVGKSMQVNVREGRFAKTEFARFMGSIIESEVPFVIDFYGHLKRSRGFIALLDSKSSQIQNRQIKSIQTMVVFFASLKIEDISILTTDAQLRGTYSDFKQMILRRRGFGKKKIVEKYDTRREGVKNGKGEKST